MEVQMRIKLSFFCIWIILLSTGINYNSKFFSIATAQDRIQQASGDSTTIDKIAFYSGRYGNREIFLVNADGTGFQRLTNNTAHDECPSFSSDGKKIAFVSNRDGNFEIYLMNPDGSDQQRLTYSPQDELHTDWSPDGTRIAFSRYTDQSHANIFVMHADGSNVQQITSNADENMRPDWSPDGTHILFNTNKDGNYEIYLMNADGSNQQRLTNTTAFEIFPQLSPKGNQIIYARIVMNPFYGEIHLRNLDGSGDVALTRNSRSENPVWSPDGKQIAFHTSRDGNSEVYVMNADGSNPRRLTNHSDWDGWPSWGKVKVPTAVEEQFGELPQDFRLDQNYPNPFNPETKIAFHLPAKEFVTLKILDVLGKEIETPLQNSYEAGLHEIFWNGTAHSSGIYFYQLTTNSFQETKKMILAK
jgi:TolB protein